MPELQLGMGFAVPEPGTALLVALGVLAVRPAAAQILIAGCGPVRSFAALLIAGSARGEQAAV
jgi:hypothetical protein